MIYMITEDYISFDTAKLLKEKGFNEIKCNTCYKWNGNFCNNRRSMSGIDNEICYQAPTLQMAIKWLRKVHNLHIWVEPNHDKEGLYNAHVKVGWWSNNWAGIGYNTYERACEAAIKYCLEILI